MNRLGVLTFLVVQFFSTSSYSREYARNHDSQPIYSSPVDIEKIKKTAGVRVISKEGHVLIFHAKFKIGKSSYKLVEDRWEDISGFWILKDNKKIFDLKEASPYVSYSFGGQSDIYFVDDDRYYPGAKKYDDIEYSYVRYSISSSGSSDSYECIFNISSLDEVSLKSEMERNINLEIENPIPEMLSRALVFGHHDKSADKCMPFSQ